MVGYEVREVAKGQVMSGLPGLEKTLDFILREMRNH